MHHNEKKRDTKAQEKDVFNFASSGCFRPKDNSEGTLKSISRLRKQSLELPGSQNTLEKDAGNPNTVLSVSRMLLTPNHAGKPLDLRDHNLSEDRNSYGINHILNVLHAIPSINTLGAKGSQRQRSLSVDEHDKMLKD